MPAHLRDIPLLRSLRAVPAGLGLGFLAACGGGGGGSPAAPPASLTDGNANTVILEVLDATGALGGYSLLSAPALGPLASPASLNPVNAQAAGLAVRRQPLASGSETVSCIGGGQVEISGTTADPDTLSPGDRGSVIFRDCDAGSLGLLDGRLDIRVNEFEGNEDPFVPTFRTELQVTFTRLSILADGSESVLDGSATNRIDTLTPNRFESGLDGSLLTLTVDGRQWRLRDFVMSRTDVSDTSQSPSVYSLSRSATGTLEGDAFEGSVDFVTVAPFVTTGSNPFPGSGALLVNGANGSSIVVTVLDATTLRLEIDADGSGTAEIIRNVPWATLYP